MKKNKIQINKILLLTSIGITILIVNPINKGHFDKKIDFESEKALFWGEEAELIKIAPWEAIEGKAVKTEEAKEERTLIAYKKPCKR